MRVYGRGVLFVSGSIAAEDGAISGFSFTLGSALVTRGDPEGVSVDMVILHRDTPETCRDLRRALKLHISKTSC